VSEPTTTTPSAAPVAIVRAGRQRHLMTEPITYEEEALPGFVRVALLSVAVLLALFVTWAALVEIDEVARAPGQVMPSGAVKMIQHLEGGVVGEILARDGEQVFAGQVLVRMDPAQARAELKQMRAREAGLLIRAERLRAIADGRAPDFGAWEAEYPALVAEERRIWNGRTETARTDLTIIDSQVEQRRRELRQLRDSLSIAEQHLDIAREQLAIREKGVSAGVVSRQVYLETKRAQITAEGEIARLREQIELGEKALDETTRRRDSLELTQRQEALDELGGVTAELAQVNGVLDKLRDRVARLEVRAPTAGLVQDLRVHAAGEVVPPGGVLMQLVPTEDQLQAELELSPRDVGHVAPGQKVKIKISTYDYTRYGWMQGELVRVSPSTFLGDDGAPHYRATVRLGRSWMGDDPASNPILPGMTIEADIVTGEKSLLAYLMRPIYVALQSSFHER